ncbi:metallophosphoesterase [Chitinophaga sp. GCM10012297]|uniref:Metallophosphoesterase family protein n=1 Tax=Chitinophaga chungangae TaxID=2821488 RepID=A0ABS3YG08_9BACT|nr:metallophosphoesterase family protein [Chitinophaga chungangae]MBO9153617.1 metallophosphoesterase family protein [Chitinophaga chungangae]
MAFALTPLFSYSQENFKITHGPYLQALGETGVNIVWTTNKKAIAWVELAPADSTHFYATERPKYFAAEHGIKTESTVHNVRIDGLKPATRYRYRVYTQEVLSHQSYIVKYGNIAASEVFRAQLPVFATNDTKAEQVQFAIINDMHQKNDVIRTLLGQVDWKNNQLVFFNGDMQNNSRSEEQIFTSFMDTADSIFAGRIPMYYARGNHETRGEFAAEFPRYFPTETGKLYYLLRTGPVCFVVLDTGEDKPDSDIEYTGIADYDAYRTEQATWLKEALKRPEYTEAPYKVVVGHIPPFGGWHGEKEVAEKFVPLLNEAGAQIMLCGHLHRNVKRAPEAGAWRFPVLVNSNTSIIKAKADKQQLQIEVFNLEGKKIDAVTLSPSK